MTDQALTKERNFFLVGFIVLAGVGVVFRLIALSTPPASLEVVQTLGVTLTLVAKAIFIYLVFRLSRFLRQNVWLTIVYCVLAPFTLLYLIPFIGLLVGVKNARRKVASSASNGEDRGLETEAVQ